MTERPYAEYAARNATPILEILEREFGSASRVLEIGSGTGQHAVAFAAAMDHLHWQTSDLDENHTGIRAWIDGSGIENIAPPLSMDVREACVKKGAYDAVFSANTAHIMGIDAVERMFLLVGEALRPGGVFCLYGPFRQGGEFNTQSNADFDANLRQRDSVMGIRDIEKLDEFAVAVGLQRVRFYAAPSNNNVAVWILGDES
jgi:cyclopropane fatty-acyl-phospholipid synthase-like methyltransferase